MDRLFSNLRTISRTLSAQNFPPIGPHHPQKLRQVSFAVANHPSHIPAGPDSSLSVDGALVPRKDRKSRLRDRAGVATFNPSGFENSVVGGDADPLSAQLSTTKRRHHALRNRMNYQEKMVAVDLLEKLEMNSQDMEDHDMSADPRSTSNPFIDNLLQRPEFQPVLEQQARNRRRKDLSRHQPAQVSQAAVLKEDIVKEIVDERIRMIDQIDNDYLLLKWVDWHILDDHELSGTSSPTGSARPLKLGDVFESSAEEKLEALGELLMSDPEEMLKQPLCHTPMLSPILLHLLRVFSSRFSNPHISIYLFDRIRNHPNPLVRYLGLSSEVYTQNIKTRWQSFQDLEGIQNDLVEMKTNGVQISQELRRHTQLIFQTVLQERLLSEEKSLPHTDPDRYCRFSDHDRKLVSFIESLIME